jgi:hypothetical protein
VTAEQSAAFLYPLVESSLLEDIQKVWQRSALAGYDEEGKDKAVDERLKSLLKFLKQEVKGAERLTFVNSGIGGSTQRERRSDRRDRRIQDDDMPTAPGLDTKNNLLQLRLDLKSDIKVELKEQLEQLISPLVAKVSKLEAAVE